MTKPRPKTGEPRVKRQPLKIDQLPQPVRESIQGLYDRGRTWMEIEEQSARPYSDQWEQDGGGFVPWEKLDLTVLEEFPQLRIPKSTLQRWYDLRVRQARDQVLRESAKAREFAAAFAGADLSGANSAVVNALRDQVFSLMQEASVSDRMLLVKNLQNLTLAMTRIQRVELQAKRVDADIAKAEAERAKLAAEAGDPREIYLLAAQDLLKKLRSRKQVREVIDPIQEDLVQELSHAAEAFAKQVEASAA